MADGTMHVRGYVSLLALGVCVGLLAGLVLAPRSGSDVRRLVSQCMHSATTWMSVFSRPGEELAEDLSV